MHSFFLYFRINYYDFFTNLNYLKTESYFNHHYHTTFNDKDFPFTKFIFNSKRNYFRISFTNLYYKIMINLLVKLHRYQKNIFLA